MKFKDLITTMKMEDKNTIDIFIKSKDKSLYDEYKLYIDEDEMPGYLGFSINNKIINDIINHKETIFDKILDHDVSLWKFKYKKCYSYFIKPKKTWIQSTLYVYIK